MDSVRNDTRPFNPLHTFCCGGRGEEVRLESRFCWDLCYRGRSIGTEQCGLLDSCCCCVPCIPVGCPECLCPCAARVSKILVLFVMTDRIIREDVTDTAVNCGELNSFGNRKQSTSRMPKQQWKFWPKLETMLGYDCRWWNDEDAQRKRRVNMAVAEVTERKRCI